MDRFQDETNNKLEYIIGGLVFLISLIVYLFTVQRTIPLWDCGEFIACSYTLGVAHPPGTPLFLLIGRIFTILPIATDISHRMNLLSVLSGASAATCGYFVAVKILKMLPKVTKEKFLLISAYICSATGALLFAFSRTNWSNSVEAEVYSLSMLLIFLLIGLSIKWYEIRETAIAQKYLVLISYLGILSIGIHMTVFLVMPVIFLFIILADKKLRSDFRFWISAVILFMVAVNISWFFIAVTIWSLISLVLYITSRNRQWLMALLISFSAIAGFSVHGYIPIRASPDPGSIIEPSAKFI